MPKRRPPSHRPERVPDETAKAIARARSEKSDQPERGNESKPPLRRLAKSIAPRRDDSPPVFPSTKRPKTG